MNKLMVAFVVSRRQDDLEDDKDEESELKEDLVFDESSEEI